MIWIAREKDICEVHPLRGSCGNSLVSIFYIWIITNPPSVPGLTQKSPATSIETSGYFPNWRIDEEFFTRLTTWFETKEFAQCEVTIIKHAAFL
jgi:hypothetical protein